MSKKQYLNIIGGSKHYRHHWGSRWAGADLRIMSRQDAAMIGEITTAPCNKLLYQTEEFTTAPYACCCNKLLYQTTAPDYCTRPLHHACCTRLLYQTLTNCRMCAVDVQKDLQHHQPQALAHDWIQYSYSFIFRFCFPHLMPIMGQK